MDNLKSLHDDWWLTDDAARTSFMIQVVTDISLSTQSHFFEFIPWTLMLASMGSLNWSKCSEH